MLRQLSAAVAVAALAVSAIVPLYCLLITPIDTISSYRVAYECFDWMLPPTTVECGRLTWVTMLLVWIVVVAIQAAACRSLRSGWWVRPLQVLLAGVVLWGFGTWHLWLLHVPAHKMLYSLGCF